jgi:hypothetical protein
MRRIREILRLQAEGYSEREIARSVGCARSSVQICLWRAERAGISWPVPAEIDDAGLDAWLYPRRPGVEVQPLPDLPTDICKRVASVWNFYLCYSVPGHGRAIEMEHLA